MTRRRRVTVTTAAIIIVVIVVVVVVIVVVLSRYLAFCLPKCVVGDTHTIPPSHPEIIPSLPAHPSFYFLRPILISCRSPVLRSNFFPHPSSPFHFTHLYSFSLPSPDFSLQSAATAKLKAQRASFLSESTTIKYQDDAVTTTMLEKRPWFHPPVPSAHCFPPNPIRPAPLSGLLERNAKS